MKAIEVVLALVALAVAAIMAYRAGYLRGQAELLRQQQWTEAARNPLRMTAVLPRWRRVTGWAAYVCSGLLLCLFLLLAFLYAKGWGWTGLLTAWALWFVLFMDGIWLAEWCWQPYRKVQERLQEQTERLRALEERTRQEEHEPGEEAGEERRQGMTADQLYPQITATGPTVTRDMVWQDLLTFGETGATPMELAARLLKAGKAKGTVEGCAMRLMPLLDELVGMVGERRTVRMAERFRAHRLPESKEA